MTRVVIFVPGIMGSVLCDGDTVVWPGAIAQLLAPYANMAALLKPDLTPTDIIRKVSVAPQYAALIDALAGCGFREDDGTLVTFPYDWRKDNALAAAALADCVEKVHDAHGPGADIVLLAHSMGGLISRCYLESRRYDTGPGFSCVSHLITMATPHRGAPMALSAALGLEKRLFLDPFQVRQLASDPLFPSLYQLLPPRYEPFVWDRDPDGGSKTQDIYDPAIATKLKLVAANLEAASAFHKLLDLTRKPEKVRYFTFAGTRERTTHAINITQGEARSSIVKLDRDGSGDGTVPVWSSLLPGVQSEVVAGAHGDIYKSHALKFLLGSLLGKQGLMAGASGDIELTLREPVLALGKPVSVSIAFPVPVKQMVAQIRLRRVVDASGTPVPDDAPSIQFDSPFNYTGALLDHAVVSLDGIDYAGLYRISFIQNDKIRGHGAELFVQAVPDDDSAANGG